MIETLNEGLKAGGTIASLIEKLAKSILGITDRKRKKAELSRLIDLLNQVRIGRTLNAGLSFYLESAIQEHQVQPASKEIEVAVQQIEEGVSAILEIIDTMTEKQDRIVLYENSAWNELHRVVDRRRLLLQELKKMPLNKENQKTIGDFAKRYEKLSGRLDSLSCDLSRHVRNLHDV